MFKSEYLNEIFKGVSQRNATEPEYLQAVEEFFEAMDFIVMADPKIQEHGIMERIIEPERTVKFRVTWIDDQGKIQVNRGFRVQFNSAIGPYKGGIRFHPTVNESILKFLGFEQTFKNALTGLPMGGGKGGADFDPRGKSNGEIMRFCQNFMMELYRHIGPDTDVPAGDIGVGFREVGYMYGMYKKIVNESTGVLTGKGLSYGGSLVRKEATGYGLLYFVQEMMRVYRNEDLKNKRIIISGSGKVGLYAALKARELGAKVIGLSDVNGCVHDPNGIDLDLVKELTASVPEFSTQYCEYRPNAVYNPSTLAIWDIPCDIALPCATQNELPIEGAKSLVANGCYLVCEGANMPTTIEATKYLQHHDILFAPGKAGNAGGVAVSGLEMTQNAMHYPWTYAEVDEKLAHIMKEIFNKAYDEARKYTDHRNLVIGANIAGFMRIYQAMMEQGVV
ncbi:MAG: NADP-specific glutamate dehydrogenase [Candidatus Izemoplasmatales bacterium]|nr:NADP-specific glutamate dehydrogenase [Candidatus Izemoplasmatales bacterium]MDD4354703.1 NADP-specific glutamate dehydrogenase [Candidatus Izemoplasmatales bacterium]MDD4988367.1 NADP-specific glutamate dehydrogenase [Candidatus Izemoplasmatales bacterium]MDY0373304.1 NADP-specific glutamate dehydrogenase [Candidatus Izemoplasmatales bacterium]NLF48174.1 NADP-specific glutamate dehydrogenase [Acholeplasmataceae bacterium]